MLVTLHFEFRNFEDTSLKYFTKLTPEICSLINSRVSINMFQTFQGSKNFVILNFDSKFMNFPLTHCKCLLSYYKLLYTWIQNFVVPNFTITAAGRTDLHGGARGIKPPLSSQDPQIPPLSPPPFLGPKNEEERGTKKKRRGKRRRKQRVNPLLTCLLDSLLAAGNLYQHISNFVLRRSKIL